MHRGHQKKIIRLLGVGFDAEDGHIRITKGEKHDVYMGSEESHEFLQKLIQKIEDELKARGQTLEDLSPEELQELVANLK